MASSPLPAHAGRVIARLARQVERTVAALDLTLPQYRILGFLSEGEAASSRLAERMAVSPPSITAVVDGLVAKGLVERRADPNDRRRLPLALTPQGTTLLAEADVAVRDHLELIVGGLDPAGAAVARDGLEEWKDALDRFRDAKRAATQPR